MSLETEGRVLVSELTVPALLVRVEVELFIRVDVASLFLVAELLVVVIFSRETPPFLEEFTAEERLFEMELFREA